MKTFISFSIFCWSAMVATAARGERPNIIVFLIDDQNPSSIAAFGGDTYTPNLDRKVLAQLNHPMIAAIYGFDEAGGKRFLVLELAEGPTLADRLANGRLLIEESLDIGRQIVEALEVAHEKGIVHRDLKPANVKVTAMAA